ncbi:hypothetical protein QYF36_000986 [Acer negundo]|nr:hypothetical protein QYF36_000986 [Acer negundo]
MDEQLVFPIVEILLRKLQSLHKQNVPLGQLDVDNIELEKLETTLSSFKAVLLDAEKQQLHNNDVRGWLKKLKDACYDAEDALDELEIEALPNRQLKMEQSRSITRKVCDFISCSSKSFASLRFTINSSKQIKKIRERLAGIEDELSKFGFKDRVHHRHDINGNVPKEREIITHSSFVVASDDVFERDGDKENIIKALMQNDDSDLSGNLGVRPEENNINSSKENDDLDVHGNNIYISGPSGIGKTTLAKLVYNDKRIDETFDIKMWYHGFNNITLIQFWMAHGLLQSDDKNEEPESIGMRYINELRCRCLFQDFEQNFDFITFKMHELVHRLAGIIAKNERIIMDSRKQYRHISVKYVDDVKTFLGSKMTRSILFFEMISSSHSLIISCISMHPNLRVLDLRNSDTEVLPESIGNLKHLRYLNLTKTIKIKRLPKSIFNLTSLETLLLGGCKELEELPRDIRHLVNLRMLVFSSKQRRLLENGIGCLTSLRRLGISSCYHLENLFEDIGCLQSLRTLIIGDCPKIVCLPPSVKDLSSLENLMFSDRETNAKWFLKMDMPVLQSIKPHLRMLCIDGLPEFNEFPQWLLQCSANTLQWLAIKNCPNLEGLPSEPLQILKSLEVLEISKCPKFSSFPEDMQGLTAMRELKVRDCPDLSKRCKWDTGEDWPKINHIPRIELDGKEIVAVTAGDGKSLLDLLPSAIGSPLPSTF